MSVRDLVWNAISTYELTRFKVDYIILTPNFFRKLNEELGGTDEKWAEDLKRLENGVVTYLERIMVVADIPLIAPVHVACAPEDMMSLYAGKVREEPGYPLSFPPRGRVTTGS